MTESSSYMLQTQLLSWEDANALCLFSYDTTLASIHNESQNDEAISLCSSHTEDCWIGLTKPINYWYWIDGTIFNFGNDTSKGKLPWGEREPTGLNYTRLKASANWTWSDYYAAEFYSLCNYPSTIPIIWDNIGYERIPINDSSVGLIDILDEIYVEFDLIISTWPSNLNYYTILRIGNQGPTRYPLISLDYRDSNNPQFHMSFSRIDRWNPSKDSNFNTIELDKIYHFILSATQNHLFIKINDNEVFNGVEVSHSILFDQQIYISQQQSYSMLDAVISNLKITTSNSHAPNEFNYLCDYTNRFTIIKGNWSIDEINCNLYQYDIRAGNIVWLGDNDTSSLKWTNYKVEATINIHSGLEAGLLIRSQTVSAINNGGQQYYFYLRPDTGIRFAIMNDSHSLIKTFKTNLSYELDYKLRVEAEDDTFTVYLDNKFIFTKQDSNYDSGSIAFRTYQAEAQFKSLRITFPTNKDLITVDPTTAPTYSPTNAPSSIPSYSPSNQPTYSPTNAPSSIPSYSPSNPPTYSPSVSPSNYPSYSPSIAPTLFPSMTPSKAPYVSPTFSPSISPTLPTSPPSKAPTSPTIKIIIPQQTTPPTSSTTANVKTTRNTTKPKNGEEIIEETSSFIESINFIYIVLFVVIFLLVLIICLLLCCYKLSYSKKGMANDKTAEMANVQQLQSISTGNSPNVIPSDCNNNELMANPGCNNNELIKNKNSVQDYSVNDNDDDDDDDDDDGDDLFDIYSTPQQPQEGNNHFEDDEDDESIYNKANCETTGM